MSVITPGSQQDSLSKASAARSEAERRQAELTSLPRPARYASFATLQINGQSVQVTDVQVIMPPLRFDEVEAQPEPVIFTKSATMGWTHLQEIMGRRHQEEAFIEGARRRARVPHPHRAKW